MNPLSDPLPLLTEGMVLVLQFDLSRVTNQELHAEGLLSEEEITRSRTYKFERDRRRFLARRMILRKLLASLTNTPAEKIEFLVSPNGKLSLSTGKPAFNLTASGDKAAFAFTAAESVGIDLEQVCLLEDLTGMLQRVCSHAEQESLRSLPEALRLEAFFHIWTQKEAYLKASGSGLSVEPSQVTVEVETRKPGRLIHTPGGDPVAWKMVISMPEPGWRVAVCVKMASAPEVKYNFEVLSEIE